MITNEQIETLRELIGSSPEKWRVSTTGQAYALRAAIDTLERLPVYEDTGQRFVPNFSPAWEVRRYITRSPVIACICPIYAHGRWWGRHKKSDHKFYSTQASALAAGKDGDK